MKTQLSIAGASLALLCLPLAANAAPSSPKPTATTSSKAKTLTVQQMAAMQQKLRTVLYSVTANSGTLTPLAGVKDGYSLSLKGVDPSTTWFTDRPYRDSGVLSSQVVAKSFAATKDPANIALVLHQPTQGTDTVVAVMRKSAYDTSNQTFTAEIRVLSAQEQAKVSKGLTRHVKRADATIPATFQEVSLFIDTNSSGTSAPTATYPPNPQVNDTYQWINGGPGGGNGCWTLYQFMGSQEGWQEIGDGCPPPNQPGGFPFFF